jgi:hypothetical protein
MENDKMSRTTNRKNKKNRKRFRWLEALSGFFVNGDILSGY